LNFTFRPELGLKPN